MVSSVMEGDIKKLHGAGYLAANIAHRLPAAGQIVPFPETSREGSFPSPLPPRTRVSLHPFLGNVAEF